MYFAILFAIQLYPHGFRLIADGSGSFKMPFRIFSVVFVFLLAGAAQVSAQTCSCAGAPLISSQTTGATSAGNLLFGVTYEYNDISALYSGSDRLSDETVTRATRSVLLEINYGITDRLSATGTFSYVDKDRTTGLHIPGGGTTVNTRGAGDGIIMLRYVVRQQSLWNRYHLALGAGSKIPFGTTSLQRNGFTMNADMQPGTGAWDGVLWSHASVSLLPYTGMNLFLITSYRLTGSNDRFDEGDSYRFGNELVSGLGVSNQLFGNLSYMLSLRYRSTSTDQLNGVNLPNTGGRWLIVVPALSYTVTDQISVSLSGQLPVYQHLSGTQPTTSFALSGSVFFNFNSNKNNGFKYGSPE